MWHFMAQNGSKMTVFDIRLNNFLQKGDINFISVSFER